MSFVVLALDDAGEVSSLDGICYLERDVAEAAAAEARASGVDAFVDGPEPNVLGAYLNAGWTVDEAGRWREPSASDVAQHPAEWP